MKSCEIVFTLLLFCCFNCYGEDFFISLLQKPEPFISAPANTTVITREQIEESNANNILELIDNTKGLFIKDLFGNGTQAEIDLRGFGSTGMSNILVLLNGRRMNNIDMSNIAWSAIPIKEAKRIEIIYGKGSVLYGDNASAGVINIITKKPEDSRIEIFGKYGSFLTRDISVAFNKKYTTNTFLKSSFNNFYTDGFRKNNKSTYNNFSIESGGRITKKMDFTTRMGFHNDDSELPGYINESDYINNNLNETYSPNDRADTPFDFSVQNLFSFKSTMGKTDFNIDYRNRKSNTNMTSWFLFDTRNTNTYQVTMRHSIDSLLLNYPNYFQLGTDLFDSKYTVEDYAGIERTIKTGETEIRRNTFATYAMNKANLFYNTNLTFGFRTETLKDSFNDIMLNSSENKSDSVNSYEISYGWLYNKKLNISLDFTNSYRFPKTDEYYSWGTLNKNLKPQGNNQTSFNIKYLLSQNYSSGLTLYNMDVKNEIVYNPATWSNENFESTNHRGIELETFLKPINFFNCNLSYSYTIAKINEGMFKDSEIPLVPQNKTGLTMTFLPLNNLSLNLTTNYIGERRFGSDFSNSLQKLEPYTLTDFSMGFQKELLKVKLGVNNLSNTKYSAAGYSGVYYPGTERNFFVSISYII